MIDVRELMIDPDFASNYIVVRTTGKWDKGRFVPGTPQELRFYGPVQPANDKDMQQVPEGDRTRNIMKFMCKPPKAIYVSEVRPPETAGEVTVSDQIKYNGYVYKIISVKNWDPNGFVRAYGHVIGQVSGNG